MESKIGNLEPKKVFKYFSDICKIPHGSGNLDGIVNYLVEFASMPSGGSFQSTLMIQRTQTFLSTASLL